MAKIEQLSQIIDDIRRNKINPRDKHVVNVKLINLRELADELKECITLWEE